MHVADDQDGGGRRLFDIRLQFRQGLHFLCLFNEDDLVETHHRVAAGDVEDLYGIGFFSIHYGEVECLFAFAEHLLFDIACDAVDKIGFGPVEEIDRAVLFEVKGAEEVLKFQEAAF